MSSRGLGRGLSALLGDAPADTAAAPSGDGVREIPLADIRANSQQPRQWFNEDRLDELAESIRVRGVLQPILLRAVDNGYEIIAGERRFRAAKLAGLTSIPALVRAFDDAASAEVALIENVQRENLSVLEEGDAYRSLMSRYGYTQDALAQVVGKSRSHIANLLRLGELSPGAKQLLEEGHLPMSAARALIGHPDADKIASLAVARNWSVRDVENHIRDGRQPERNGYPAVPGRRPQRASDPDLLALERQLGDLLGVKVRVAEKSGAGTVTLSFSSLDQLDLICQRLSGEPI